MCTVSLHCPSVRTDETGRAGVSWSVVEVQPGVCNLEQFMIR